MILALAGVLEVPLREQNALLQAAGFAATYVETSLDAPQMADIPEERTDDAAAPADRRVVDLGHGRGSAEVLARRIRVAIERRSKRVIYPRAYHSARWFPWLARWLVDAIARRLQPTLPEP